uniref:ABC transporter domain-containing protein n=1 Tax=Schistocephalus solidus TaxID=70667 RepID=A0A0X3Q4R1_SCHSO
MSNSQEKEENKSVELTQPLCLRKISFCQHYRLLLWKSFLLRSRQPIFLVFELFLPLILIFVLVGMRYAQERAIYPPCHITSQPLPSMGFFTHLRSLICSANLTCTAYDYDRPSGDVVDLPPWLIDLASLSQSDSSDFLNLPLDIQSLPVATVRRNLEQITVGGNESALATALYLIDTLGCGEKTYGLLRILTSRPPVTTLARAYCRLPVSLKRLLRSALEGRFSASDDPPFAFVDGLLAAFGVLASEYSSFHFTHRLPNMTALLEAMKRISIPVCGSRPGQNDFLALADDLLSGSGKLHISNSKESTSIFRKFSAKIPTKPTACSVLNAIFAVEVMRPWTLRLRTLMQGHILYHPDTPLTQRIVRGANLTTIMFERLKNVSNSWVKMEAEVLPTIFVNSTLARQLRNLAKLCLLLPNQPAITETCRRLKYFLEEDKLPQPETGANTTVYLHWSDLIEPIAVISAAVDNILSTCINYNRFIGYSNTTLMEERAQNLSAAGRPVMMLYFDAVPAASADLSDLNSTLFSTRFRLPFSTVDGTRNFKVLDKYWSPWPRNRVRDSMKYFTSGFIDVQEQITRSYISIMSGLDAGSTADKLYSNPLLPVEMKFVPGSCYQVDPMLRIFASNMPMIIVIIWICNVVFAVRAIVYEKECRLKEFTKVMGMGNFVHWLNWWTVSCVTMGAPSLCTALVFKFGGIFPNSDFFVILCCLLAYLWSIIPQAFFVSVFYTKANFAAVVSGIFYFVMFIPYAFVLLYDLDYIEFSAISLCPQVALALAFTRLGDLERTGQGAQWNNLWGTELTNENFTLGNCLVMLLLDGILALVCTAYLEAVLPGTYGVPQKWYFLCTSTFWKDFYGKCCCRRNNRYEDHGSGDAELPPSSSSLSFSSSYCAQQPTTPIYDQFHEPPPDKYSVGVSIRGLTKTYHGGKQTAVNNLWADFYEGQITSFLGHNGAGKTTTMSILTGIYPASSGGAYICGKNIKTEMSAIRTFLGLCPQHNILYDRMTVREHLRFYGSIKGLPKEELDEETNTFLEQLDLTEKADDLSKSLSGGQKRRLSLAAAFIGGSKIVFLDEPTAGVDPHSRRSIWKLILRFRESRTIILTTHHMDEADVLGDRIVIISQGHLKASGSSLFLKSNFAKSYYLTVEKTTAKQSLMKLSPKEVDRQLMETMTSQLSGIQLITSNPTEWVFSLPAKHALDDGFSEFFAFLDSHQVEFRKRFGFAHYGLSDTTLEEIFLLLADDPSKAMRLLLAEDGVKGHLRWRGLRLRHWHRGRLRPIDDQPVVIEQPNGNLIERTDSMILANKTVVPLDSSASTGSSDSSNQSPSPDVRFVPPDSQPLTGVRLYAQQMKACLVKRLHYVQRSKRGWFLEMVLPACTVLILMAVTTGYHVASDEINMPLHPWLMANIRNPPQLRTFFSTNVWVATFKEQDANNRNQSAVSDIRRVSQLYADHILSRTGWSGAKCLPSHIHKFIPAKFAGCSDSFSPPSSEQFKLTAAQLQAVQASANRTCSCASDGRFLCDLQAVGGFEPPTWSLATSDILYNLTGYNISDYLLKTRFSFILKRYGGLEFVAVKDPTRIADAHAFFANQTRVASILDRLFSDARITQLGLDIAEILRLNLPPTHFARIWYNNKGYTASVAYLNLLHNLQLRMLLPQSLLGEKTRAQAIDRDDFAIVASTHPIPLPKLKSSAVEKARLFSLMIELFKSVGTILALSYVPSSFVLFLIRERCVGSKNLQFMSGLNRVVYWLSTYIWDICNFLVPVIIIILIFLAFHEEAYVGSDSVGGFIAIMVIFGLCIIPLMYLFTFVFRTPSLAFVVLLAANVMIAVVTSVTVFLLDMIQADNISVKPVNDALKKFFLIFPQYAFSRAFYDLALRHAILSFSLQNLYETDLFAWDMLGSKITSLLLEAVLFFGAVLAVEYNSARCRCQRRRDVLVTAALSSLDESMDQDVMEERLRVFNDEGNQTNDIIRVKGVTKRYPKKKLPAVDDLTFGVRPGECFGLLGVNGAGKTTTFNMLTNSIKPDKGEIWINGCNLETDAHRAHAQLGYCPQFDALHPHLTGYETLQFYARIRGFPENNIKPVVDGLIDRMSLRPHANKKASAYSGGNRRKLSTAVAILGNPRVLLLDEPTSGMDPGAKRYLWDVLKSLLRDNCSIVLTSHSMEECEALCNRVGIMVAGQFHCFGTVPRLKERFGEGYIVEVDVRAPAERVTESLRSVLGEENIHLTEAVGQRLTFQTSMQVSLAVLFRQLVTVRNAGEVNTFAVRQASLDSVFINFIRRETETRTTVLEDLTKDDDLQQDDWYYNSDEVTLKDDEDQWIEL